MYLDDVAVDFPDMPIILAHPSFPWQEEALSVATHKPQVYIDLSGWSPKYFPPILVQYANTLLKDKVLFGTDFPVLTPERWMADLEKTAIRDEVKPGIFKGNAVRLLGLGKPAESVRRPARSNVRTGLMVAPDRESAMAVFSSRERVVLHQPVDREPAAGVQVEQPRDEDGRVDVAAHRAAQLAALEQQVARRAG